MFQLKYSLLILLLTLYATLAQDSSEEAASTSISNGGVDQLTQEKCGTKRSGCCSELYLGDKEVLVKCFTIHSSKLPADGDTDIGKSFKFLSCFVECLYKQRKYIGKSDTINMKMVKLDAEHMFAERPKEQEYHIQMYDYCRKDAVTLYNTIKASPGARVLLKNACRPFLLMVYLCQSDYHQKHGCPYFRWEGAEKKNSKQMCLDAKAKCYELDGLTMPEETDI